MRLIRYDNPIEGFTDFREYRRHIEHKSRRSKKALDLLDRETHQTRVWATKQRIKVLPIPKNLLLLTTEHYGNLPDLIGIIAYIRHNYTNYEDLLKECENTFGREDAYRIIKEKTVHEICKKLEIPFSVEYIANRKLPWLIRKDFSEMMEMYR